MGTNVVTVESSHSELGGFALYYEGNPELLFTENDTNNERIFGTPNMTPYVKDAFHNYVVAGRREAVDTPFDAEFSKTVESRQREANEFYRAITPVRVSDDTANVMRQALAGMLWSKQYFFYDTDKWFEERGADPLRPSLQEQRVRNCGWFHLIGDHIISMPDKWEYPWFAAGDLAFQAIALIPVDIDFAKQQLDLPPRQSYLHPTGQIPAYEWNFSDVAPPVQAWAAIFLYRNEQLLRGRSDVDFLKHVFGRLTANFGW